MRRLWGAEQDGEDVSEPFEVGELREREGRQKKRVIWFPNSKKDEKLTSQSVSQSVRQTDRQTDREPDVERESDSRMKQAEQEM